jgi:hypothetical protein
LKSPIQKNGGFKPPLLDYLLGRARVAMLVAHP